MWLRLRTNPPERPQWKEKAERGSGCGVMVVMVLEFKLAGDGRKVAEEVSPRIEASQRLHAKYRLRFRQSIYSVAQKLRHLCSLSFFYLYLVGQSINQNP